jgi:sugar phosphate isomerase/epimerase
MNITQGLSRRNFISGMTGASAALVCMDTSLLSAETVPRKQYPIIAFSKAFQDLSFEDTADLVAEVGWDGIECPVRKNGQVLPERIEEDLPKMVEALRKRQRSLVIMATDIADVADPLTEKVLRIASKLGIRLYRLKHLNYRKDKPLPEQITELRAALSNLVTLNRELGLCAGFQNHSGTDYIGAPVWDIHEAIKGLDPRHIQVCFDIGHATVEGGYAWPLHARLMAPRFGAVYVKDFTWQKSAKGWQAAWCPLGEGMINRSFFNLLKATPFRGPICQHHEYPIGHGQERVRAMQKDLAVLKSWLS